MPKNTTKRTARHLVDILAQHGVRHAVLSPGSRNTPLIMAFERHPDISTTVVIDERTAAFVALGISMASFGAPVAVCCTSGTAPLNYGPALAEAYYRGLPLIAVTADRPEEWIDQDDSQTIRQAGIYGNFTKTSVDLPVESSDPDRAWMTDRLINEAVLTALADRRGPVQINVRLDAPLADEADFPLNECPQIVRRPSAAIRPDGYDTVRMREMFSPQQKVLVLAGFLQPGFDISLLESIAALPNVVVMREAQSNLGALAGSIGNIDATLSVSTAAERERFAPDVVVTLGGSLLSRYVKTWLRGVRGLQHVAVNDSDRVVDPFKRLVAVFDTPDVLASLFADIEIHTEPSPFKSFWLDKSEVARRKAVDFAAAANWSDFKAMDFVLGSVPSGVHLQVSNGTAIRYIQMFDYSRCATVQCNRGVSGIDGCTSTAVGAALVTPDPTLLISGDMSFAYDIGALALGCIPANFKIVVLNNGGGGIFRFIPSTARLPELERCFVTDIRLPLRQLAEGYGFRYICADSSEGLVDALRQFWSDDTLPVILDVHTPGPLSADILREFFKS
ncbi:MAG: 2-succinyl-5-enolpyruvyl-6-hydroxy-3-cyclohexene-1-carboxylic-acid synthase [Muribaculaceae bacterium]|nr:2-succinyl-5-enolpyruvyl-6-hydroxy-3-cyclohexene-1-carboxylic-acid synthase [Muribaculaceae bacterium]